MKGEIHPRTPATTDKAALRLVEGTAAETGTGFFRALVRNLARALGTLGAWATEYLPEEQRLRSYAMWMGKDFVDHFDYPLGERQLRYPRGYDWPGNVRELQNIIERAVILTSGGEVALDRAMAGFTAAPRVESGDETPRVLSAAEMEDFERTNIRRALEACGGKVPGDNGAARLLGIPASTLGSRMKALGVRRESAR